MYLLHEKKLLLLVELKYVADRERQRSQQWRITKKNLWRKFNNKKSIKHSAVVKFPELIKSYRSGVSDMSEAKRFTMRSKTSINYCAHRRGLFHAFLMLPLRLYSHFSSLLFYFSRVDKLKGLSIHLSLSFAKAADGGGGGCVKRRSKRENKLYHLQLVEKKVCQ